MVVIHVNYLRSILILKFFRKSLKVVSASQIKRPFKVASSQGRLQRIQTKTYASESERKIKYAVKMYCDWRSKRLSESPCVSIEKSDIVNRIGKFTQRDLCDSLCMFANEICRMDNKDFPPNTLKGLIYNIQMYLRKKRIGWRLFDPIQFMDLRNTIDNLMKERTAQGLGQKNQAHLITFAMEEILWEKMNLFNYFGLFCILLACVVH